MEKRADMRSFCTYRPLLHPFSVVHQKNVSFIQKLLTQCDWVFMMEAQKILQYMRRLLFSTHGQGYTIMGFIVCTLECQMIAEQYCNFRIDMQRLILK
ncbi:MAG: hypothetical protein II553_03915, partial [Lachnospiraceae bacterium]|nr:hypothetical protein [Lachnospiraceae bacterium]